MPDQKVGIEIPSSAKAMIPASVAARPLAAAATPRVTPTTTAVTSAVLVRIRVDGNRSRISRRTGWPLRMESPKSPRTAPPTYRPYWT